MSFFQKLPGVIQFLIVIGFIALLIMAVVNMNRDESDKSDE